MTALRLKHTEGVHKACLQQLREAGAFLVRKACILTIAFGIGQVDLRMGYIQVAADDDGLFLAQLCYKLDEILILLLAIVVAFEAYSGVGRINRQ